MQKMDGKICDSCRSQFYPGDTIHEVCSSCFNNVWCVMNIYADGSKELSSIHRNEEAASHFISRNRFIIGRMNETAKIPIKEQKIEKWAVL